MKSYRSMTVWCLCALVACLFLSSCKDAAKTEKAGRLEIFGVEYSIRQTHGTQGPDGAEGTQGTRGMSYVIDARGKVKNVGDVDVKNVIVTGYCRSCTLAFTGKQWFTSDCDKTPTQKAIINYLPAGAEEEFNFAEIAFYFTYEEAAPTELPEKMEVVVDSFETAD